MDEQVIKEAGEEAKGKGRRNWVIVGVAGFMVACVCLACLGVVLVLPSTGELSVAEAEGTLAVAGVEVSATAAAGGLRQRRRRRIRPLHLRRRRLLRCLGQQRRRGRRTRQFLLRRWWRRRFRLCCLGKGMRWWRW